MMSKKAKHLKSIVDEKEYCPFLLYFIQLWLPQEGISRPRSVVKGCNCHLWVACWVRRLVEFSDLEPIPINAGQANLKSHLALDLSTISRSKSFFLNLSFYLPTFLSNCFFQVRWACICTSKDWNSPSFILLHYPKILTKTKTSQFQCNQRIPHKEFLPKKSSQKNPPKNPLKKFLPNKSSQKIPPKKFRHKNSSKKILRKNSLKISKKNSKKIQKNSKNSPTISKKI